MQIGMRQLQRAALGMLIDSLLVLGAFFGVIAVISVSDPDYSRFVVPYLNIGINLVFLLVSLLAYGVYRRLWHRTSGYGVTIIVYAVASGTLASLAFFAIVGGWQLPLQIILLGNILSLVGFVAVRYRSRLASGFRWRLRVLTRTNQSDSPVRVLIIGAGQSGQTLAWQLKHHFNDQQYRIVGFIDDDLSKQGLLVEEVPIIGTRKNLIELAERHAIELIVVAIHNINGPTFREVLTLCEKTKALIKVVPNIQDMVNARHSTEVLRDVQAEDLIGRTAISRYGGIDLAPITNKVILVTGAAGSIGSELSRQIMNYAPSEAILLDNNESGLHDLVVELRTRFPNVVMTPALADITSRDGLRRIFAEHRPQIVFHAAAYKHVPMLEYYPNEAIRVNVSGSRNLAELAQEHKAERFVLISTDKAVNPSSVMGASKRLCELMLHYLTQQETNQTYFAAVRFGNVLGSRGSVVPTFNRQIDAGGPVTVTHPDMTRYFMSIPEAVNLIIHAACMTDGDDIYVLQMGEVVRIVELAERMIRLRGLRPYQDIDIQFTGIRPGEKMHEELFNDIETPHPTKHPQIMRVNRWRGGMDAKSFWASIDALVSCLHDSGTIALTEMTHIIEPTSPADQNGLSLAGQREGAPGNSIGLSA